MNIAFGTVLIFLIIIPGIIYRKVYFHGIFSKKYVKTNPFDDFAWAIIPGFVFQISGVLIVNNYMDNECHVNFKILGVLLAGAKEDLSLGTAFEVVGASLNKIFLYNLIIWAISAICGFSLRIIIRKFKLDWKTMYLRFNNEWFYIVTGEILGFSENTFQPKKKIDFTFVDVLVKIDNESIIYTGISKAYFLSNEGGLASLLLAGASRRLLSDDPNRTDEKPPSDRYYNIPGEFLLIPNSSIININFRYIDLDEETNNLG